jgi:hypothetical protein
MPLVIFKPWFSENAFQTMLLGVIAKNFISKTFYDNFLLLKKLCIGVLSLKLANCFFFISKKLYAKMICIGVYCLKNFMLKNFVLNNFETC